MKGYLRILILLPTLAFSLASFVQSDKTLKTLKVGKGAPLTDYQMMDIDGTSKTLNGMKTENGLLVVFSCNTCPFVVGGEKFAGWEVQYNAINELAKKNKIAMVLVNSNEAKRSGDDSMEAMKNRAKEKGYTMSYVEDKDSKLADAFGARTTPHIFLFDKDLKLVYTGSIDNSWDSKRTADSHYLDKALEELGKGEKISVSSTDPRGCGRKRIQQQ